MSKAGLLKNRLKNRSQNRCKNQSGQMAIFVALLFQVLFVFFAMVINVGLMVHDKINLQNSVDLATYYAAQKQAEILNAIAHSNYQIRQSWKLLAWRARVLGDVGRLTHPSQSSNFPAMDRDAMDPNLNTTSPSVCIDNEAWAIPRGMNQSTCKTADLNVPPIPRVPIRAPFIPWTGDLDDLTRQAQRSFGRNCQERGPTNWQMAARWLASYKLDVANRKQVIWALAKNLKDSNFRELSGGQVMDGIRKTLLANLTRSNRESVDSIQIFNSLEGLSYENWLPEVHVIPVLYYTDSFGNCRLKPKILNPDLGGGFPDALPTFGTNAVDPAGTLQDSLWEALDPTEPTRSSWGFEKNPWYMAYMGVKVRTRPKHPFAPFGRGVEMVARAFAQPFGGRIGPWLKREWLPAQLESSGDFVDELAPERYGSTISQDPKKMIPNFSRYPGDRLGLLSTLSLTSLRPFVQNNSQVVDRSDYGFVPSDLTSPNGDALAWSTLAQGNPPQIRRFEIAGIVPNFFDVMYYSIDPDFSTNYIVRNISNFGLPFPLRLDLGARNGGQPFSIQDQIQVAAQLDDGNKLFYQVKNSPAQLLTGWAPQAVVDYRFPSNFASCTEPVSQGLVRSQVPVPGSCIVGGRTGYSVKLVSKDYLKKSDLELGGQGVKGPLKVKPPDDF